ncbi:Clp amino terminal domain-containing protein, pathogenicity island component [Nonomuraea solani]|uniref:Clp amino terminal domain-containing protein, pathogenicity island component n=1 Tax=Nonomuraea solani TaxID=1144553 RepID=A0A1H6EZP8_9ACTN|nr:Clp protease N-terminal domain-containing protein [Nonomuraea solani]SEH02833.1 Clp amino terminal domain-containing protein, pathogenicity island component [Nonomuraea solani]
MFARFTEDARRAVVKAGIHALDAGRPTLDPDLMLLALAEVRPFALASFTASADDVRERVAAPDPRPLLATLGIDLDEVHRRTRAGADEPALWTLRRSRVRPLRVTLYGPLGQIPLAMHTRKVIEVAQWRPGPVTGERLLWGLLADHANGAARILYDSGVDLRQLVREARIPA